MDTRDVWMELVDRHVLIVWMDHKGETVRSLAAKCVVKDPRTGKHRLLSHQTIGYLRSGARRTCTPSTAKAIEKALDLPSGMLFHPRTIHQAA